MLSSDDDQTAGPRLSTGHTNPVETVIATRRMKCYAIQDSELKNISGHNRTATIAFSLGTGFLGAALTIFLESKFNSPIENGMEMFVNWGITLSVIVGACCYIFGANALLTRGSIINTIRDESE